MSKYLLLLSTLLLVSCSAMRMPCPCQAVDTVIIEGKTLRMDAEIWVDKMPTTEPAENKNTNLSVRIYTSDNSSLPEGITADMYIIKPSDDSFIGYEGALEEMERDESKGFIALKDNNGPEWESGQEVDIAILVTDKKGIKQFIRNDKVEITAVY